jgi:hypothetical protein
MSLDAEGIDKHSEEAAKAYYSLAERIATLSTGALALSISLREHFAPASSKYPDLLSASWACFAVSIFFSIAVHWGKNVIHLDMAKQLQANPNKKITRVNPRPFYAWAMKGVLGFFFLAVILLTLFAILNNG